MKLLLGETSAKKIQQVPSTNNTIKKRILLRSAIDSRVYGSADVKQQVIAEIRSSHMFVVQLDIYQQMLHHARSSWYLFDTYIRRMLKKGFCIAILWKL